MINNYLKNTEKIKEYHNKKEFLNDNIDNLYNYLLYNNIINNFEYLILKEFNYLYKDMYTFNNIKDNKLNEFNKNLNKLFNELLNLITDYKDLKDKEIFIKILENNNYVLKFKNKKKFNNLIHNLICLILNYDKIFNQYR